MITAEKYIEKLIQDCLEVDKGFDESYFYYKKGHGRIAKLNRILYTKPKYNKDEYELFFIFEPKNLKKRMVNGKLKYLAPFRIQSKVLKKVKTKFSLNYVEIHELFKNAFFKNRSQFLKNNFYLEMFFNNHK